MEHLLCGDVLTAWRLVAAPSNVQHYADEIEGQPLGKQALRIARVTTKEGQPVVGIRVSEELLPQLRYVLSCQHQSVREQPKCAKDIDPSGAGSSDVQDLVTLVAGKLLQQLQEAEDKSLPY